MRPLINIHWDAFSGYAGYDVHIVRPGPNAPATSEVLDADVNVTYFVNGPIPGTIGLKDVRKLPRAQRPDGPDPDGFTVTFELTSPQLASHGVTLDATTGVVTVGATPPELRNFIVNAVANHSNSALPMPLRLPIRVHIHDSISSIFVSPNALTLRPGFRGSFTIFASFEDQSVGDITRHQKLLTWASDNPSVATVGNAGTITPVSLGTAKITVSTAVALGTVSSSVGNLTITTAWQDVEPALTLLPGGPGLKNVDSVPNFLLISEGFTSAQRTLFQSLARDFETRLRTNDSTLPFKLLRSGVNIFTSFIASGEDGSTIADEVAPDQLGKLILGQPVPQAVRPAKAHAGPEVPADRLPVSTIEHLIYRAGLPVGADGSRTFPEQLAIWTNLHGADHVQGVTEQLHSDWVLLSRRRFFGERDTAFGLRQGDRPRAEPHGSGSIFTWHPSRAGRSDLDALILQSTISGKKIGGTWAEKNGKDRNRVIVLCHACYAGAFRTTIEDQPLVAVSLADNLTAAAVNTGIIMPPRIPALNKRILPRAHLSGAHEMAHTFLCGDEYGGTLAFTGLDFTGAYGNLQRIADLTTFDPVKVKWNYPRIRAAGLLIRDLDNPKQTGTEVLVKLPRAHVRHIADAFKPEEVAAKTAYVFLRKRPLTNGEDPSPRMALRTPDPVVADDTLALTVDAASSSDLERWLNVVTAEDRKAGLVLYAPLFEGATMLRLMTNRIANHIKTSQHPLNRKDTDCGPTAESSDPFRPSISFMIPVNLPKNAAGGAMPQDPFIVGIYDNGFAFDCGVSHSAGSCLMRSDFLLEFRFLDPRIGFRTNEKRSAPGYFCPVCRYLIADQLDPSKHAAIDDQYRFHYDLAK